METRNCQNCKKDFKITEDDFSFYEKIKVPPPTFCPECRFLRRAAWRNERHFHKLKCQAPGHDEQIISMFHPGEYTVYDSKYWWSDAWNALDYGTSYDFSQNFFTQFFALVAKVPLPSLWSFNMVNSDYANYSINSKNAYMCCSSLDSEDVYHSSFIDFSKEVLDSIQSHHLEVASTCLNSGNSSRVWNAINIRSCIDCWFVYDCVNCQDCFMSSNLRNKRYVFRNKQLTKEEYEKVIDKIKSSSHHNLKELKEEFNGLMKNEAIHRFASIVKSDDVSGDDIENSKNVQNSFCVNDCDNVKHSWRILKAKDIYDVSACGVNNEQIYEATVGGVSCSNCKVYTHCSSSQNLEYSLFCRSCQDCFGCVSLQNKKYCIFNKQYSETEYFELREKIINQMDAMPYESKSHSIYKYGEFFPQDFSFFGYNESLAQEMEPKTKKDIGPDSKWIEKEERIYVPSIHFKDIPKLISDVSDSICQEIIECESSGKYYDCTKAFRITSGELTILKKLGIPLPLQCPSCRYHDLVKYRNPFKLWPRSCMCKEGRVSMDTTRHDPAGSHDHEDKCKNEFETSYSPDRSEKVYCESCYQKAVL